MNNRRFSVPAEGRNGRNGSSLQAAVEILRRALEMVGTEGDQAPEKKRQDTEIQHAQTKAKIAEANWQAAWEANRRIPGVLCWAELDQLRLAAKAARAELDGVLAVAFRSRFERMRSDLNRLCQDVGQLDVLCKKRAATEGGR